MIDDIEELRRTDRFREANELRAFIEVEDGRIVDAGYLGQRPHRRHDGPRRARPRSGSRPSTCRTSSMSRRSAGRPPASSRRSAAGWACPTPRPVPRKPFVQFWPSIAWTTLELTINADGTSSRGLVGASPFPRHWIYDDDGALVEKSGLVDFKKWFNDVVR